MSHFFKPSALLSLFTMAVASITAPAALATQDDDFGQVAPLSVEVSLDYEIIIPKVTDGEGRTAVGSGSVGEELVPVDPCV